MKLNPKLILVFVSMIALIVAISGCTQTTPAATATPTPAPTGPVVLTVKGQVDNELALTMYELQKYESQTISVPGKDNVTESYTGISYNKLLDDAGIKSGATSVHMIGADGYNKSIELSSIRSTPDAIIAINPDNSLKSVIPGQSKGAWVGQLVTIEIE